MYGTCPIKHMFQDTMKDEEENSKKREKHNAQKVKN
jgi:hypothetical protein